MRRATCLALALCGFGIFVAIGIGWCPENASGAGVGDSSSTWLATQGNSNNNFVSPVQNQGNVCACVLFSTVSPVESWYKITRGDATNVWCGASLGSGDYYDQTGLSEQTLSNYNGTGSWSQQTDGAFGNGNELSTDFPYQPNNQQLQVGILNRTDDPCLDANLMYPENPQPNWTVYGYNSALVDRRLFTTGGEDVNKSVTNRNMLKSKRLFWLPGRLRSPWTSPLIGSAIIALTKGGVSMPSPIVGWQNIPTHRSKYTGLGRRVFHL